MFELFRSFLPLHNPIGFGTSDFIELALAALLVLLIVAHAGLGGWARRLAARTGWCMLALAILPLALRLAPKPREDRKQIRAAFALTEPIPFVGVETGILAGKVRVAEWLDGQEPMLQVEK